MILTIDIGNSNIIIGAHQEDNLLFLSHIRTDSLKTSDEYAILFKSALELHNSSADAISGAIISSVVPSLISTIKQAIALLNPVQILTVGPGIKTGLNIKIDNPAQLGTDFVCVSVAALEKYPSPLIVFDMDTATTIAALDKNGHFIGGSIVPGVKISLDALCTRTAQLPQISFDQIPNSVVGTNTVDSMKSGILFGTASMIDGMIERYKQAMEGDLTIIATGDVAGYIIPLCQHKITHDRNLTMDGLRLLYYKNIK